MPHATPLAFTPHLHQTKLRIALLIAASASTRPFASPKISPKFDDFDHVDCSPSLPLAFTCRPCCCPADRREIIHNFAGSPSGNCRCAKEAASWWIQRRVCILRNPIGGGGWKSCSCVDSGAGCNAQRDLGGRNGEKNMKHEREKFGTISGLIYFQFHQ